MRRASVIPLALISSATAVLAAAALAPWSTNPGGWPGAACFPDCNENGALNVGDFACFQGKYVVGCP